MYLPLCYHAGSPLAPQQVSELTHKGVAFNRGAGMAQGRGHHSRAAARQGRWAAQEDVSELVSGKEGGGHDLGSTPAFSLTLGKDGLVGASPPLCFMSVLCSACKSSCFEFGDVKTPFSPHPPCCNACGGQAPATPRLGCRNWGILTL